MGFPSEGPPEPGIDPADGQEDCTTLGRVITPMLDILLKLFEGVVQQSNRVVDLGLGHD